MTATWLRPGPGASSRGSNAGQPAGLKSTTLQPRQHATSVNKRASAVSHVSAVSNWESSLYGSNSQANSGPFDGNEILNGYTSSYGAELKHMEIQELEFSRPTHDHDHDQHHHHHDHHHDHHHHHDHDGNHSHSHNHSHGHSHSHGDGHSHTHSHARTHEASYDEDTDRERDTDAAAAPTIYITEEEVAKNLGVADDIELEDTDLLLPPAEAALVRAVWSTGRNSPMQPGEGRGKVLFMDAQFAGVAGDMMVAALLDLGVPLHVVTDALQTLPMDGYSIEVRKASRSGIVAPRFVVHEEGSQPYRDYATIRNMIENSNLPVGARDLALRAFLILAAAEASVHGMAIDDVHFHEVGAVDSIVDIISACVALDYIDASAVITSPLPMGRGMIYGAAHGPLPNPAPALLNILCISNLPSFDAGCDGELVTPTGACLLAAAAGGESWRWPAMRPLRNAYGAGTKSFDSRPNLFRIVLGEPALADVFGQSTVQAR